MRERVLKFIAPVGEGLFYDDAATISHVYATPQGSQREPARVSL